MNEHVNEIVLCTFVLSFFSCIF